VSHLGLYRTFSHLSAFSVAAKRRSIERLAISVGLRRVDVFSISLPVYSMDAPILYYCKACQRTYDGHAQCCFEMEHIEVKRKSN